MTFEWTKTPPADWQADLDRLSPGENVSRLMLSWLAGTPDEPVQRWVLYETIPASAVTKVLEQERVQKIHNSLTRGLWDALKGPDPRTEGKWVTDASLPSGRRWRSKSLVSRNQWDLHQQTGGLPLLCWIIEGEKGGHSWQFGVFEQSFLIALGVAPDMVQLLCEAWPNPGTQPYADYDQRVFRQLAERDLLVKWRRGLAWNDRANRTQAGLILDAEAAGRREDMLSRVMVWMDAQIGDVVSDIPRTLLPEMSNFVAPPLEQDESPERLHRLLTT